MKRIVVAGVVAALAAAGCNDLKLASVSGVVKLNNRPYKNAVVSFQPLGTKDNINPGRGSAGITDENGRFTLTYDNVRPGAVAGKHRVRIFTHYRAVPVKEGEGEEPLAARGKPFVELIPAEWNELSEKDFEVPARGTDQANFDIQSVPPS